MQEKHIRVLRHYIAVTGVVALATGAAWALHHFLPPASLSLVFLVPVLFAGAKYGLWPSFFSAFLSTTAFNFFFTEPLFTLDVYHYDDIATLIFFLLVAFVTGNLTVRLNKQIEALRIAAHKNAKLSKDIEETRLLAETERLRAALLSSVSHDLRTPLSSIIGSVTTLQDMGDNLSRQASRELLNNVLEEAQRLNGFIQKLLDMTRLGQGKLRPNREWVEFRDILGRALKRIDGLSEYDLKIETENACATLFADPVLMEQVFVNILENAVKYAPPGTGIKVFFGKRNGNAIISFTDEGPGIPEKDRELVFDMFYRVRAGDTKIAGTGLGLAICKGLVGVHDGRVHAGAGPGGRGTSIVITFPASTAGKALEKRRSRMAA